MINTDNNIIDACRKHGARKVFDAVNLFMCDNKDALPSVGLKNPIGIIEADYIGLLACKMMRSGRVKSAQRKNSFLRLTAIIDFARSFRLRSKKKSSDSIRTH